MTDEVLFYSCRCRLAGHLYCVFAVADDNLMDRGKVTFYCINSSLAVVVVVLLLLLLVLLGKQLMRCNAYRFIGIRAKEQNDPEISFGPAF